jgi:anti-sigma factor RsiW
MTIEPIAEELLAAFLDGTASQAERQFVLSRLAASEESLEAFVEANAIQNELHAAADAITVATAARTEEHETSVQNSASIVDINNPRAIRKFPRRFVVAAGLAAALLAFVLFRDSRSRTVSVEELTSVALAVQIDSTIGVGAMDRSFGAGWNEPAWSVTRSAESTPAVAPRAFRTGVRFAQLVTGEERRDSTTVARAASHARDLIGDVDGSGPLASQLNILARTGSVTIDTRSVLALQLRSAHNQQAWFDLGVVVESARIALLSGDPQFLRTGSGPRRTLDRLLTTGSPDREWIRSVAPLLRLLKDGSERVDREETLRALADVYRAAGG